MNKKNQYKSPNILFCRYWRNEIDQAEDHYLEALKENPNFVSCIREFGNLMNWDRGNVEVGQKFYERAKTILKLLEELKVRLSPDNLQD